MPKSPLNLNSQNPFAGVDHISFDTRVFKPSTDDIELLCKFFTIGKLEYFEKEKNVIVSHSNFFFFVKTDQGQYALKFYPPNEATTILREYAINQFLRSHDFATPIMYTGRQGVPFLTNNDRLATCFAYIDGKSSWEKITEKTAITQINASMLSLNRLLTLLHEPINFQKKETLTATINTLAKTSKNLAPYSQKILIHKALSDACHTYHRSPSLFSRQWIHNNTHLGNFHFYNNTVYTLDLSHIWEDYILSDLARLIVSCLLFKVSNTTIKTITTDYFAQNTTNPELTTILRTIIQIKLIDEYLKNLSREKMTDFSAYPKNLTNSYRHHLSARMQLITSCLDPKILKNLL